MQDEDEAEEEEEEASQVPPVAGDEGGGARPTRKKSKKLTLDPAWTQLLADPRKGMLLRDPNLTLTTPEELLEHPYKRKFELVASISLEGPLTKPAVDENHVQDGCLTNAINSRCGGALPVEVRYTAKEAGASDRAQKVGEFRLNNADEQAAVEKLTSWAKACIALKEKHIAECGGATVQDAQTVQVQPKVPLLSECASMNITCESRGRSTRHRGAAERR